MTSLNPELESKIVDLKTTCYHISIRGDQNRMTYVVTDSCIRCKYMDCVEVCPVDCFHEGPNFLAINPDECIDCNLCVAECPVDAIYADDDLPEDQKDYLALNAKLSKQWPVIDEKKSPPADADDWANRRNKRHELVEEWTQDDKC